VRALHRAQILSLEILNQGCLERASVVEVSYDGRQGWQSRCSRGPPSTFARHELIVGPNRSDEHWLENTVLAN
jgi:hypothetical protein